MRTTKDRIRHTLLFEGLAIVLATLIVVMILGLPVGVISALTVTLSLIAMLWNYLYNCAFDAWQLSRDESAVPQDRKLGLRVVHAVGFELGFLLLTLPLVMWWLSMGFWQALLMDVGFALFFMLYALAFNWAYDLIFPLKEPEPAD